MERSHEVTELLVAWGQGDREALDRLVPLVQKELRQLASGYLHREAAGHTLQATGLVNEAYIKLIGQEKVSWQSRAHFFGIAAQAMRRVLVDHARQKKAAKRGGSLKRVSLHEADNAAAPGDVDILALHEALAELGELDPRQSRIVELRYFGGLSVEEAAQVLEVSPATVKRDWSMAKAWLYRRLDQRG